VGLSGLRRAVRGGVFVLGVPFVCVHPHMMALLWGPL